MESSVRRTDSSSLSTLIKPGWIADASRCTLSQGDAGQRETTPPINHGGTLSLVHGLRSGITVYFMTNGSHALEGCHGVKCKASGPQLPLDVHQARVTRVRERSYVHLIWARPHYQMTFQLEGLLSQAYGGRTADC